MHLRAMWGPLAFAALCLSFLFWRLSIIAEYSWTHDEGAYISAAWMVSKGYALYHETMTSSPPLFIHLLSAGMSLWGPSVTVARLVVVAYLFVGFVAVGLMAKELDGWLAALVAPLLLMAIPTVFEQSTRAFSTLPAMCLISVAIVGKMRYIRTGQRRWVAMAGVVTAAALLTKLVVLFSIPFLFIAVLLRHVQPGSRPQEVGYRPWSREILIDTAVAYACLAATLILYVAATGPQAVFDNVIRFQLEGRLDDPTWLVENLKQMGNVLGSQRPLILLAIYGALQPRRARPLRKALIVAGVVAAVVFLVSHSPLYDHHIMAIFVPLSVLAGVGISALARQAWDRRRLTWSSGVALAALGLYVLFLPGDLRLDRQAVEAIHTPDESESVAIHFLQETTAPQALVFSDEPMLPLLADRQILPSLTEVSWKRLRVGDLSAEKVIDLTEEHQPAAIVIWKERFENSTYDEWVREHYYLAHLDSTSHRIYLRSPGSILEDRQLTDKLKLLGYNYDVEETTAGALQLKLSLFWRPLSPAGSPKLDLKIMDSAYHVWGATSGIFHWSPDALRSALEFVPDSRVIDVWPGTPPGQYRVTVAYYGSEDEPDEELSIGPIVIPRSRVRPEVLDLSRSVGARLADQVSLLGYKATDVDLRPGDSVHLTLFWQALIPMDRDYTVFVHLQDAQGRIVSQSDHPPVSGFYPTSSWEKREIVRDP
jgi:hypothetical protein